MAVALDRLVRKEVSLGAIREKQPPKNHIGIAQIAPFLDVDTDDAIFEYIKGGYQEGLAPSRAEDAEAELAQKDELTYGQGRASVVDWALKDKYTASDVSRYREDLLIGQKLQGAGISLGELSFQGRTQADFEKRIAREDTLRRKKLDNRLEWLIMQAIETNAIAYNDGKQKWTVTYGRPGGQTNAAPAGGNWDPVGNADFDPIGDILAAQQTVFDTYGVMLRRIIGSRKALNRVWQSTRFLQRFVAVVGGTPNVPIDPRYAAGQISRNSALALVEEECGVQFIEYDAVYETRAIGSSTRVFNRFLSDNKLYMLPPGDINSGENADGETMDNSGAFEGPIDDTEIGFAKTLTAPHPEGQWTPGFYEWEDESKDPWLHVRGSGIKAFPVFPYMQYTYTMQIF